MNRKDEKGIFKKLIRFLNKKSSYEKKKREEKKRTKPKGYVAKKLGVMTFWGLFLFMFLFVFINMFASGSSSGATETETKRNMVMEDEGLSFAKEFVYEYFNWSIGDYAKERRIMQLERYLVNGLDEMGGIEINTWSSTLDKRNIVFKHVEDLGDNKARYIFKITFTMREKTDEKDTKSPNERLNFEETLKEEQKMKVINGYKTKTVDKYISVPIIFNETESKFGVYELPSFTYIDETGMESHVDNYLASLNKLQDRFLENNILAFLDVFFESYSKDPKDKLSYILEDEAHQNGLAETMNFISVKEATIYTLDEDKRFIIDTDVVLTEPSSNMNFTSNYLLVVDRKDQRYVVKSLNDEPFVKKIIQAKEELEESNDTDEIDSEETNGLEDTDNIQEDPPEQVEETEEIANTNS